MEILGYFARPIEHTGKVYQLVSLLIDGNYIWHSDKGNQEQISKLAFDKNRQLQKGI